MYSECPLLIPQVHPHAICGAPNNMDGTLWAALFILPTAYIYIISHYIPMDVYLGRMYRMYRMYGMYEMYGMCRM